MTTVDIKLKKANKTYREGDHIVGLVVIQGKGDVVHNGITLFIEGSVNMQLSAKSVGLFEAFYNSVKPITLINGNFEIAKPGKIPSGKTEIPFDITLKPHGNRHLYETYHGVFINIQYMLRCEMRRTLLNKDLIKTCEFLVEVKSLQPSTCKPVEFRITPGSLHPVKEKIKMPSFALSGKLDSAVCSITQPFTGELVLEFTDVTIKSIELQLVRVETCGCAEGYSKDPTEIQNLQIADGDICRGIVIPLYMIFPRLFTCPTLATTNFKIEFELNVVLIFADDHLITENFPIQLIRE